jgi:hypothetical protein
LHGRCQWLGFKGRISKWNRRRVNLRISGSQDLRISGSQDLRISGSRDLRISGSRDLGISGFEASNAS